ncbi:MAG: hypothetical protein MZV64_50135 [Ignavibacteriales bacterium]|nr:hypothetical protein [Ignavibacteriales bacterium]
MIALEGDAPGHVLGVRIEPAVLVDDDDAGELAGALGLGRVGLHPAAFDRIVDVSRLEAGVVLRGQLGSRPRGFQSREQDGRRGGPAGERGQPAQEFAAVHPPRAYSS